MVVDRSKYVLLQKMQISSNKYATYCSRALGRGIQNGEDLPPEHRGADHHTKEVLSRGKLSVLGKPN